MTKKASRGRGILPIVFIAYLLICGVWSAYRVLFDQPMADFFENNIVLHEIIHPLVEGVLKSLFLILPPILLMKWRQSDLKYSMRKVFTFDLRTLFHGVVLSVAFFAFYSISSILRGGLEYNFVISADDLISSVFFAAITEEIMYRGFILNALVPKLGKEWGNVITAILFSLMHVPLWIMNGTTAPLSLMGQVFSTACIGYLLGWAALHSRGSIWGAVMAHAFHNYIVHLIN